jgi:hypothetical protein
VTIALITKLLAAGLLTWFALLLLLITIRALRGDMGLVGLLRHSRDDQGVAPERVLAMAAPFIILANYVMGALHSGIGTYTLPEMSDQMVNILIASNGIYIAGKIARN